MPFPDRNAAGKWSPSSRTPSRYGCRRHRACRRIREGIWGRGGPPTPSLGLCGFVAVGVGVAGFTALQTVTFDLVVQGGAIDLQQVGGLADVPAGARELSLI